MVMGKNRDAMRASASAKRSNKPVHFTEIEKAILGIQGDGDETKEIPHVNLKYYSFGYQCFSEWNVTLLRAFSDFCRKLKQLTWAEIYKTGGQVGSKTGLGYTPHRNRDSLLAHQELAEVSPDLTFFELRIDQEARVHGFRMKDAFFLVWLDKDHKIYR